MKDLSKNYKNSCGSFENRSTPWPNGCSQRIKHKTIENSGKWPGKARPGYAQSLYEGVQGVIELPLKLFFVKPSQVFSS